MSSDMSWNSVAEDIYKKHTENHSTFIERAMRTDFKTYLAEDNSYYATIRTGTWDSTNNRISWNTPQVLASYSARGQGVFGAAGDGIVQVLSSLINAGNDYIKLFSGTIDSSSGSYTSSNVNVDQYTSSTNNYYQCK